MAKLMFEITIPAPLDAVWEFFNDPANNLPKLSPPSTGMRVESADMPMKAGSGLVTSWSGPFGMRIRWVGRIVEHRPPHGVVFGRAARFVDELVRGPLAYWRHEHDFEAADARTTRMVDRITYRPPWGPLGWLADGVFLRWMIVRMFRVRYRALNAIFDVAAVGR